MKTTAQTSLRPSAAGRASAATVLADLDATLPMLVLLALLTSARLSPAAVTVYEPFDYAPGVFANGTTATGSGLSGNWTCGAAANISTGLTYTGLPVAHNALSSTSGRQFASFANALGSGTKWVSFLFSLAGNNGANICGVYFPNGGTGLFFGFGLAPFSGTQGGLGLGSTTTTSTSPQGAANLASSFLGTYGTTYLVVLKIDFNTSGANDTVTVYLNPTANAATPGVAATYTVSSFDVGTITGIGFQNQGGGFAIKADEIRVGDSYADVVGFVSSPPSAPTDLSAIPGDNAVTLTWTAANGSPDSYNIKRSTTSGSGYTTVGTTTAPTVTFTDAVLGGATYFYVVSAVNGGGESDNSPEVSASPVLAPPAAPTGLMATAGNAQVSLSWTASSFATGYEVRRATTAAGPYTTVGSTTAPVVTYHDASGLANGTTYYYVVAATGAGGSSPNTAPISATPFGPQPLVVAITRGQGIRWFASNNVLYQVQWSSALLGSNTVWHNLGGSIMGNGATNTVFDPVGAPHNFYQVLSIQ